MKRGLAACAQQQRRRLRAGGAPRRPSPARQHRSAMFPNRHPVSARKLLFLAALIKNALGPASEREPAAAAGRETACRRGPPSSSVAADALWRRCRRLSAFSRVLATPDGFSAAGSVLAGSWDRTSHWRPSVRSGHTRRSRKIDLVDRARRLSAVAPFNARRFFSLSTTNVCRLRLSRPVSVERIKTRRSLTVRGAIR